MKLAVEVIDAADLMPKDGQGSASAFVEVDFDGQRQRTATKPKDLNPSWHETLLFDVSNPTLLPTLSINISVYHDRHFSFTPHNTNNRTTQGPAFLGRVRISGSSVFVSPREATVQRFPLEKRGLFSHVSGDIALRVYLLPESAAAATDMNNNTNNTNSMNNNPPPVSSAAKFGAAVFGTSEQPGTIPVDADINTNPPKKKHDHHGNTNGETRAFYSVPASTGGEKKAAAAAAPPPPPGTTVILPRPPGAPPPPGARPDYGLIETRPPLAARLGPRAATTAASKIASTYDLVEPMPYLYVSVVKARDLPPMDLTGSLDPYVEVKLGNYKGVTRHFEKNQNPIFRQVFAFSRDHLQSSQLEVTVKDKDFVKDDFVGRVVFDMTDIPHRVPPDSPLAPQWYKLEDKKGNKLERGEVMLAVWIGTQADEAFPEAWHSDAHSVSHEGLAHTRSKVYFSPKLAYLRVLAIAAQDLVPGDKARPLGPVALKIQLGHQLRRTRPGQPQGSMNLNFDEEFMFVAAEPFDEPLVITAEERVAQGRDEPIGRLMLHVASAAIPRNDLGKQVESKWFSLSRPEATFDEVAEAERKKESKFSSKVHLRLSLETGYHVLDESTHYSSDFRPTSKKLHKKPIGLLELGILSARDLIPMKAKEGRATDPYCIAKYGPKWVRTRTLLNTLSPQWNEQYTWEVSDPCTVITVAVFDNCHVTGHNGEVRDQRIGKVRIRLSTLETDRIYTHFYPLLVLTTSGLKKTGELHLAVRFTCMAWVNMLSLYGRPLLPKMHYTHPISVLQLDYLRHNAMQMVAQRLARAEPPLRREVVEYMLDVDSHMFSLRRSKANFYRIMSLFSGMAAVHRWYDGIRNWRNPITTVLVHVLILILVCYPELILPTVFLYLFMIGIWNYRFRPRKPPHMDTKLSQAEMAHPDELDEEFDSFPTSKASDLVRMRYDRLRSVAGRVQTVVGDIATQGERAQALLSWRDPRATTIFIIIALIVAVILYVTPFQVIAVVIGLYLLRHPRFRSKMPSVPFNFYKRLPAKSDMLI